MTQKHPSEFFGPKQAEGYETAFAHLSALRDAMTLLTKSALMRLREDARLLCVGAGTGLEIRALAQFRPGWHFTAVEPAPAMMTKCREAIAEVGLADRCSFHEDFLDSLEGEGDYDAATALLVSHFILDADARLDFYRQIARRLKPGAILVTAELLYGPDSAGAMAHWLDVLRLAGMDEEQVAGYEDSLKAGVHLASANDHAALVESTGFNRPLTVFQAGLMQASVAVKA